MRLKSCEVLNLICTLYEIRNQLTVEQREVCVFGVIDDIFILGRIDEISQNVDTGFVDIIEFKTRSKRRIPTDAQLEKDKIQVLLYKRLFDNLVCGKLPYDIISLALKIDLDKTVGYKITKYIDRHMWFLRELSDESELTVRSLLDMVLFYAGSLPCINRCYIDYAWQGNERSFYFYEAIIDDQWLDKKLRWSISYWNGRRESEGVDIEELWKCYSCDFRNDCEWRNRAVRKKNRRAREIAYE